MQNPPMHSDSRQFPLILLAGEVNNVACNDKSDDEQVGKGLCIHVS